MGEIGIALRVGEDGPHAVVVEALMQFAMVVAGRFHDDARDAELAEPVAEDATAVAGVSEAALERGGIDEDVQPVLADVDADDGLGGAGEGGVMRCLVSFPLAGGLPGNRYSWNTGRRPYFRSGLAGIAAAGDPATASLPAAHLRTPYRPPVCLCPT